jgi:DNA polymerase elongation subunit (family B)
MASWSAKWLGEDTVMYSDLKECVNEKQLLQVLVELLDDADIVVAHYGDKFDLPTINSRCLVLGIRPPSPFKTVDTKLVSSRYFHFPSNSLEYLSTVFGVTVKDSHKKFPGFELWIECMKDNPEAWEEMKKYNIQDVIALEQIYLKMRPFIKNHPNVAVYEEGDELLCSRCGSTHVHRRGYAYTNVGRFQRYQCNDCGGWGRTRFTELKKRPNLLANT